MGGLGEVSTEPVEGLNEAIAEHAAQIIADSGAEGENLELVHYSTQVVAGTNYFCKLQVDGGDACVHARIFQGLPHTGGAFELHGVEGGHDMESEISAF